MKKVIGFIDQCGVEYDEHSLETGCGGSEAWVIYLSREFAKDPQYHVIVFNNLVDWHFDEYGVEWVPTRLFERRAQYQHFDNIIISRAYEDLILKIEASQCCKNVYLQAHDWMIGFIYPNNTWLQWEKTHELHSPVLKRIVCLSEHHIGMLGESCNVPSSVISIIPNGIDPTSFENIDIDHPIDKTILWSSRPERGCDILCNHILPLLRKTDPEWSIDIASYDPIPDEYRNREGIQVLGKLGRAELYKEMSKHACWFYPSIYPETFNISSIEAVMCGNLPVLPMEHGMATTFKYFKSLGMNQKFSDSYTLDGGLLNYTYNELGPVVQEAVERIMYCTKHYHDPAYVQLRSAMRDYLIDNYSWLAVKKKWEKLFEEFSG